MGFGSIKARLEKPKAPQQTCLGGCGKFAKPTKKSPIPLCRACRKIPKRKNKAMEAWRQIRSAENIESEAERATRRLPRKDAYTPMQGEKLVLKMMRGEW
jgi:hypothetical protein